MKRQSALLALLLLLGVLGIVCTYTRLSYTADERWHVACGMEWWQRGTYTMEPKHSPLTRIFIAALPYGLHEVYPGKPFEAKRDASLRQMLLQRIGILPFYILSCLLVFLWSRKLFGGAAALWSLALYVSMPTVTAHGALATTDMGYTSMLMLALMAGVVWLDIPDSKRSLALGISLGLMIGSKFSGLVHWPIAMSLIFLARCLGNDRKMPIKRMFLSAVIILPALALTLALIYRFSLAPLWQGIHDLQQLNRNGFAIWLFEPLHNRSVWYFFPVLFFFKTSLPFHIATLLGNARIIRGIASPLKGEEFKQLFPLLAALGVLLTSMTSNINIGVRHVLPLYPLLAIPAGYGLYALWQGALWKRLIAAFLLLWQIWGFASSYPDEISYFNELAGKRPEHIALDSDFDWGQGMVMLDKALQERHAETVHLCLRGLHVTSYNAQTLLHAKPLACPNHVVNGWIAVSRSQSIYAPDNFAWLAPYEAIHVGNTINLYYITPQ